MYALYVCLLRAHDTGTVASSPWCIHTHNVRHPREEWKEVAAATADEKEEEEEEEEEAVNEEEAEEEETWEVEEEETWNESAYGFVHPTVPPPTPSPPAPCVRGLTQISFWVKTGPFFL